MPFKVENVATAARSVAASRLRTRSIAASRERMMPPGVEKDRSNSSRN